MNLKLLFLSILAAAFLNCSAQLQVKAAVFGVPTSAGGAFIGHAGFEYLLKERRQSLELNYHMSRWSGIGSDGPEPSRKWITAAFQCFIGKNEIRKSGFLSFFTEIGTRKITPGFIDFVGDSILSGDRASEIAPGVSVGKNFSMGKRWSIQPQAGPKIIFARYTTSYYHRISSTFTEQKHNEIKAGLRFQFSFCYQL